MMHLLTTFASETAEEESSLFGALGIDWRTLILQIIAFAIMVWVLGKFVYPHLIKAIDDREKSINESVKAAANAEANAEQTQVEIEKLFKEARIEAASVIETAHREAAVMVKEAEDKSKVRADQIIKDARAQLDQDISKARQSLRAEATELVALATEKIIKQKVDSKSDAALIASAIKETV